MTQIPRRALDVVRALAVLCVLLDHTFVAQIGETSALWALGRLGVLLFFVHTALVLMSSLERQGDGALAFYVRRAFRIYPLAIVSVVGVVALDIPSHVTRGAGPVVHLTTAGLLSNLALVTNLTGTPDVLGPLWSLPIEVQMYAVLPLCGLVARRGVRPVLALLGGACILWLVQRTNAHLWRLNVLAFAPVFVLGVLAYARLRIHPLGDLGDSRLTRGAHTIATYSYGVYLMHVPTLAIAFVWAGALPRAAQWSIYTVLLIALPAAVYHGVEKPAIALGRHVARYLVRDSRPIRVVVQS